jgi:hypothetical protein
MALIATVMFVLTLLAFAYGALGYAGASVEIGWLFGLLALTFLVAAARLDNEQPGRGLIVDAEAQTRDFGPYIRMKLIPAAANGIRPSADAYSD